MDLRSTLIPTKEACNGAACASCIQPNPFLVTCSACKRAKYCNKECQRKDWKEHKAVCKLLQAFQGIAPEIDNGGFQPGRLGMKSKFNGFKRLMDSKTDIAQELCGIVKMPSKLSDKAWQTAEQFVLYSPCCSICKKNLYVKDGDGVSFKCCQVCKNGWCCKEHWEQYEPKHTREICQLYLKASSIDRFFKNHIKETGEVFLFLPESTRLEPIGEFPKTWDEYYRLRSPTNYNNIMNGNLPEEILTCGTRQLTQVVTCLLGMYTHDQEYFTSVETINIHVVGAAPAFELEGGGPTCIWEEIMHCLPAIKNMTVTFIGPDSFERAEGVIQCCPDCNSTSRTRAHGFSNLPYHEYRASGKFRKPDFIVAYNTGMYEEYTESWKQSLEDILDLNIPSLFTSYNLFEAKEDYKVLQELNAHILTDAPVKNPFGDDFPTNDLSVVDGFYGCNDFYICFRGRK